MSDEPGSQPLKNAKKELFCQEYLIDLNGTQAAIRATYSPRTAKQQASKMLLDDEKIQKRDLFIGDIFADCFFGM